MIKVRLVKKIDGVEVQNGDTITLGLKVGMPGAKGRSVISIIKTATQELTDTYTITYSDNTTSTFDVVNGTNGTDPYVEAVARGYEGTEEEFYTDLATISSKQDALGFTPENIANKGANNGYAGLDAGGKVPIANLPSTLLVYKGVWNASTNTPELTTPDTDKKGWVYNVSVAGTQFGIDFKLGDWAIFNDNGVIEKSDNSDDVVSVNGQQGVVILDYEDVGASPLVHNHSGQSINPDNVVINKQYTDIEAETLPVGTIFYNIDQKCWLLKLSSVNYYNFGEELPVLSRIGDNQNHLEGQACFVSGGETQLNNVSLASSVTGKLNCLATQDVLNAGDKTGYYCYFGQVRKFPYANVIKSTDNASTWIDGADLYLCNEAGKYSTVKEAAPAKASYVGRITNRNGANITVMFIPVESKATTDLSDWGGSTNAFADAEKILIRKTNGLVQEMTKTDFYAILDDYFAKLSGGNTFSDAQNFDGRINHKIGEKFYSAASKTADTINDIRWWNNAGVEIHEICTAGSTTKEGGTWSISHVSDAKNKRFGINAIPFARFDININSSSTPSSLSSDMSGAGVFIKDAGGAYGMFSGIDSVSGDGWIQQMRRDSPVAYNLKLQPVGGRVLFGGDINMGLSKYQFNAASPIADTINDTRTSNQNGVEIHEICTAGSTTKGGGTWVETFAVSNTPKTVRFNKCIPYDNTSAFYALDKLMNGYLSPETLNFYTSNPCSIMSYSQLTIRTTTSGGIKINPANGFNTDFINGNITIVSGKYTYQSASPSADTINDRRTSNNAGVKIEERCTGNGATKGGGTWVVDTKIHSNGINEYADNSAAIAAGLTIGTFYRTGDLLKIVH